MDVQRTEWCTTCESHTSMIVDTRVKLAFCLLPYRLACHRHPHTWRNGKKLAAVVKRRTVLCGSEAYTSKQCGADCVYPQQRLTIVDNLSIAHGKFIAWFVEFKETDCPRYTHS